MSRTCPSCGADAVADDAAHCHRCGAKLDAAIWPPAGDQRPSDDETSDWRTAASGAGVGYNEPAIPSPRDPHGSHAQAGGPLSKDSTTWAMGAHFSAFLGAWVALAFIGPLIVWLVKRDEDPFVERHAREALNFNLLLLVLIAASVVFAIVTIGFGALLVVPLGVVLGLTWIVLTVVAGIKAANGEDYSYPFNVNWVK